MNDYLAPCLDLTAHRTLSTPVLSWVGTLPDTGKTDTDLTLTFAGGLGPWVGTVTGPGGENENTTTYQGPPFTLTGNISGLANEPVGKWVWEVMDSTGNVIQHTIEIS